MKVLITLTASLTLLFLSTNILAQSGIGTKMPEGDSLAQTSGNSKSENKDSVKLKKLEFDMINLEATIKEMQNHIKKDSISAIDVGSFKLVKTNSVQVYTLIENGFDKSSCTGGNNRFSWGQCYSMDNAFRVNISNVNIEIKDGVIAYIQASTGNDTIFETARTTIPVSKFNSRHDLLSFRGSNHIDYYIKSTEILRFISGKRYSPDDIDFVLTKKDEKKFLKKDVGINSIINVRLFTDLTGTFAKEDNAIGQTDVNIRTFSNHKNAFNVPFYGFRYFFVNMNLSRFDDKYKYSSVKYAPNDSVFSSSDTTIIRGDSTFSRQLLNQRKFFNLEIGHNIIHGLFSRGNNSSYGLDFLTGVSLSNFANARDTFKCALPYFGFNGVFRILPCPNFGIILSGKIVWQYAPELKKYKYGQEKCFVNPELELFWNPNKSPGNKLFVRARYVVMVNNDTPFLQLQLGYNISFTELINKKLEDK